MIKMDLFKKFMGEAALVLLIAGGTANACSSDAPLPKKTTSQSPTDENGQKIKKPIPTGCVGKIKSRRYQPDTNDFLITYYTDDACRSVTAETITFEQDLNATCDKGDHFPICLTPSDTEPPGMRTPTENP